MFLHVTDSRAIDKVAGLARIIWREHFTPIIGAGQVAYMLEKFQSAVAIREQLRNGGMRYFLIRPAADCVGYFAIKPQDEELFLSKFYILAEHRGRGYGRKALAFIEDLAREDGAAFITLTVNRHNSGVIRVYEKMGFAVVSSQVEAIGGGYVMDDYVMQKLVSPIR